MKKLVVLTLVSVMILVTVVLLGALGYLTYEATKDDPCLPTQITASPVAAEQSVPLTVKGVAITQEQLQNATTIVTVAVQNDLPVRAAEIAIMTAEVESELINVPFGDRDSLGLFQQRKEWGPRHVRMNPEKSAQMFFTGGRAGQPGLTDIANWQNLPRGVAAQAVQVSALPDEYAKRETEAIAIVAQIMGNDVVITAAQDCEETTDPIEIAVQKALSRTGDDYEWGDANGSGLVSWAFGEAGITLPKELSALAGYEGSDSEGVEVETLTAEDITSADSLQRGDLVFLDDDGDGKSDRVGVELGPGDTGAGSEFRIATYNITVKQQFANYPAVVNNIKQKYQLDVVGTQELESDNYRIIQREMTQDGTFGIYPDKKPGEAIVRHGLNARAILYRTDRFVLDESRSRFFRYPRYPEDGATKSGTEEILAGQANAPVAFLTDKVTGQEVIVIGFHSAAFKENAERRYRANLILVEQVKQLQTDYPGVPIFLTGDFNEGTGVRGPGDGANYTYQQRSENLLYCMFAANKLMFSTEAESRGQATNCPNSQIGGVDYIYASQGVQVASQSFTEIPRGVSGSDHPAKFVDVVVPGVVAADSKIAKKWLSTTVGRDVSQVNLTGIDSRRVVKVLRLTVTNSLIASSGEWVFPLQKGVYTYSAGSYGERDLGGDDYHNGTDFGTNGFEAPLVAMHDGTIVRAGYAGAWGNHLVVETGIPVPDMPGETYKYLYAHLSSYTFGLSLGAAVEAGQSVGNVGDTGNSFGEHLHLTICTTMACTDGNEEGSTDPIPFLASIGIVP